MKRKVQKSGPSTFTISLPKEWCAANHIEKHSELDVLEYNGVLVLIPPKYKKKRDEIVINADKTSSELNLRRFLAAYISGFDIIKMNTEGLDYSMKEKIRRFPQNVIGVEIIEEDASSVVFQDLLDFHSLSLDRAFHRVFKLVFNMEKEAILSMLQGNKNLAREIISRDKEIDRLYLLVRRNLSKIITRWDVEEENQRNRDVLNIFSAIKSLERIGDHAEKIARNVLNIENVPKKNISLLIDRVNEKILHNLQLSFRSFQEIDINSAQRVLESEEGIRQSISQLKDRMRKGEESEDPYIYTILDSLERIAVLISDIGEAAIDRAV